MAVPRALHSALRSATAVSPVTRRYHSVIIYIFMNCYNPFRPRVEHATPRAPPPPPRAHTPPRAPTAPASAHAHDRPRPRPNTRVKWRTMSPPPSRGATSRRYLGT
eukprot:3773050-Prymnesium_polylepis.1